jgi:hypothetical protein
VRIALIAMSGIRACDAELLELGLTLPGFVERSRTIASLPSLGLLTLAGMTPAEHEVHYFEVEDVSAMAQLPLGFDLVAISSLSAQVKDGYRLAERYRALGMPVVMGGLHVTANPHISPPRAGQVLSDVGRDGRPAEESHRQWHGLGGCYAGTAFGGIRRG